MSLRDDDYDLIRMNELGELRRKVLALSLGHLAYAFAHPDEFPAMLEEFDDAVKALAAKLNEPETCYACGQEKAS
jgi:hypothetical protein